MKAFRIQPNPSYLCSLCKERPAVIIPNLKDPDHPETNVYSGKERLCEECARTMGIELPEEFSA